MIPNWISEEICDSIYRKNFIESLVAEGLPIYFIAEENYTDLANGEEGNLSSSSQKTSSDIVGRG